MVQRCKVCSHYEDGKCDWYRKDLNVYQRDRKNTCVHFDRDPVKMIDDIFGERRSE